MLIMKSAETYIVNRSWVNDQFMEMIESVGATKGDFICIYKYTLSFSYLLLDESLVKANGEYLKCSVVLFYLQSNFFSFFRFAL